LQSLAHELKAFMDSNPEVQILFGHGAGSFAHVPAKKYGTRDGLTSQAKREDYWKGFAEVRFQAAELNRHVTEALVDAGIPAFPLPPSSMMVTTHRKVTSYDSLVMRKTLEARLLPIVYGDVFLDEELGGTILSTEDIFASLAEIFPPARVLIAGIESGVWADFPARTKLVTEIRLADYEKIRAGIGISANTDVTGGMKAKVEEMFALIQKNQGLTVQIFSAEEDGFLTRALNGENVGTLLRE
jgi:isopentenyl phosphate kinase